MAPGQNLVALLNTTAGKGTTPRASKRKLHPDEIQFPASKKRTIEHVRAEPPSRSKHVAVSPDANVARKPRRPLPKSSRVTRSSPLKNIAFDAEIRVPNGAVRLDESPAYGTRARAITKDLVQLSQSKTLVLQSTQSPSKAKTRDPSKKKVPESSLRQTSTLDSTSRSTSTAGVRTESSQEEAEEDDQEDEEREELREEDDGNEQVGNEDDSEPVASDDDEQPAERNDNSDLGDTPEDEANTQQPTKRNKPVAADSNIVDDDRSPPGEARGATSSQPTGKQQKKARKDSQQVEANVPDKEDVPPPQSSTKSTRNTQIDEDITKLRRKFLRTAGDSIDVNDCRQDWADVGSAMLWLKEQYNEGTESRATLARALRRTISELTDAYREFDKRTDHSIRSDGDDKIADLTTKFESRVDELKPGKDHANNIRLATDLSCYMIPSAVQLLCTVLRIRFRRASLAGAGACALDRMVNIVLCMIEAARSWDRASKPCSLEIGTYRMIHHQLKSGLNGIKARFQYEVTMAARRDYLEKEVRKLNALEEQQRTFFERQARQRERMLTRSEERPLRSSRISKPNPPRYIHDIEDFDSEPIDGGDVTAGWTMRNNAEDSARNQRQTTEEIPAPPFEDWSELENTALLNGLQTYLAGTRYAEILNAYSKVLEKRDIDDVLKQARYFRQVMTNGSVQGTQDMDWLMSVS